MRQVGIQKRRKRIVTLGAVIAGSVLLSTFQPAAAQALVFEAGRGSSESFVRGDIEISVSVREQGAGVCAWLRNIRTGEPSRSTCAEGADVEVSDTLDSAWGRGTAQWSTYKEAKGRGAKAGGTYTHGTTTIDVAWTGVGETTTEVDYSEEWCWAGLFGECIVEDIAGIRRPSPYSYQWRRATLSGTVTDSEWGTLVIDGAVGYLSQPIL